MGVLVFCLNQRGQSNLKHKNKQNASCYTHTVDKCSFYGWKSQDIA